MGKKVWQVLKVAQDKLVLLEKEVKVKLVLMVLMEYPESKEVQEKRAFKVFQAQKVLLAKQEVRERLERQVLMVFKEMLGQKEIMEPMAMTEHQERQDQKEHLDRMDCKDPLENLETLGCKGLKDSQETPLTMGLSTPDGGEKPVVPLLHCFITVRSR